MRRLALAALALTAALPAGAWAQIGIIGGYNRDSFGTFVDERFELAEEMSGFNTGIFLDFEVGRFGLRPGIMYQRLSDAVTEDPETGPTDLEIIELPFDIRISAPLPVVTPYILAGPSVIFPSSARPVVDEALAGARIRWGIGVGVEWDLGFRLWPEFRYVSSFGGLVEDDETRESQLSSFVFRLGVSF